MNIRFMPSLDTQLMHSSGAWTVRTSETLEHLVPVLSSVVKVRCAPRTHGGLSRVSLPRRAFGLASVT